MWLYESDNSIEYRFGPSNILEDNISLVFDGGTSPISGLICSYDFNNDLITGVAATNDEASPEIADLSASEFPMFTAMPSEGRVIRWERSMIVGVSEEFVPELTISPNPFSEEVVIDASNSLDKVEIIDVTGKTVLEAALQSENYSFDTSELVPGMYFLRASRGEQIITKRIIKS